MSVPEEAVEAAARADYERVRLHPRPPGFRETIGGRAVPPAPPWEEMADDVRERFRVRVRPMLEAAAPFMGAS